MSNETTPAVERAANAVREIWASASYEEEAQAALTAALTDPDDPDSLARTLWHAYRTASGWGTTPEAFEPVTTLSERVVWRAVADGLRAALLGGAA